MTACLPSEVLVYWCEACEEPVKVEQDPSFEHEADDVMCPYCLPGKGKIRVAVYLRKGGRGAVVSARSIPPSRILFRHPKGSV